jgi:hypothetical protein
VNLTGVSLKTVRRRIKDGTLPRVRLDRRVLIPFAALLGDDPRAQEPHPEPLEAPHMATAPTLSPHRDVDATGRALPMTDEEIRRWAAEAIRGLQAVDDMGDEEEQRETLEYLIRAIDSEPLSDRKRFG